MLAVLDEREPLDAAVAAVDAAAEEFDRREAVAIAAVAEGEQVADAEAAELGGRRGAAAALVPDDVKATYERIRSHLGGIGAARLIGRHCDGCHLELPATELDRMRHLPADGVAYCDQCGRILVRP